MDKKSIIQSLIIFCIVAALLIGSFYLAKKSDSVVVPDPIVPTQTINQNLNTYTDSAKTFSFSYPKEFFLTSLGASDTNWAVESVTSGSLLAKLVIPKSFMPQTNFGDATFTVGSSGQADSLKNCLVPTNMGNIKTIGTVTIGGKLFSKINFIGAGAGNYYDTTSYRIIYRDQCYAVEYTIHSMNIYNYPTDQGIKEFDQEKIKSILENIVQTFTFTQ